MDYSRILTTIPNVCMASKNQDGRLGMDSTDSTVHNGPVIIINGHMPSEQKQIWFLRNCIGELVEV